MLTKFFRVLSVALLGMLVAAVSAPAAVHYVPDDFAAIQEALDGCENGDTIILRDGTYFGPGNKNLDFNGKALTVRSENGRENCVIDCEGDGRGFYFHSGETLDSVVDGITIVNGSVPRSASGGGISCYDASPTIVNCVISSSVAGKGGGINCQYFSSPDIINCRIENNFVDYYGGGICLWSYASPSIKGCTVTGNTAQSGGGMNCGYSSSPALSNCTIKGNTATNSGGGIDCFARSSPAIVNCTIVENGALSGGGSSAVGRSDLSFVNSILWQNTAVSGGPQLAAQYSSSLSVSHSDVEGGEPLTLVDATSIIDWSVGNIDADPVFAGAGDYHLTDVSPCVDGATDAGVYDDIDGDMRPQGAWYDMGSDELVPFVDNDGDGHTSDIDCDDDDADVFPGAPELCDGKDNDCDGVIPGEEADVDGDGYMVCAGDCDDLNPDINPGTFDIPGNGIDENCDGILSGCDPNAEWKNHGQYVRCVVHDVRDLVKTGVLTPHEGMALIIEAAKSDVGKKAKPQHRKKNKLRHRNRKK